MAGKWYVCTSDEGEGLVSRWLALKDPQAVVVREDNPWRLRALVGEETGRPPGVLVGSWRGGIEPVNVAAAIVADAHASQVVLACRRASGSLRSRAARAGIARVLTFAEMVEQMKGAGRRSGRAASGKRKQPVATDARHVKDDVQLDDLDEPEGIDAPSAEPSSAAGAGAVPGAGVSSSTGANAGAAVNADAEANAAAAAPLLCVASGRGGVGKTTLAATMAALAARWGMRVALVDLDLGSGNLPSCMGLSGGADLTQLGGMERLDARDVLQLGAPCGERLSLWGPCDRPEMAETLQWRVARLLEVLREEHDLVVVDTSTTFTDAVAQAVQACDRLLLVADDRTRAVASLSRAASLAVRLGVARTRIVRVMNRCLPRSKDDASLYRAAVGLETARTFRVLEGDEEVPELLDLGRARELADLGDAFSASAATCLASILSELGCLPDDPAAHKALKRSSRSRHGLFGRMREAS